MSASSKRLTGLIVEDEPRFREFLADVLRDMEIDALPASTAMSALRMIRTSPPDLLLLDLNLPIVDGMTFLEQFRAECPTAPVLIISAFGDLDLARRAIHFEVTEFLSKPCELQELEAAIRRALHRISRAQAAEPGSPASGGERSAELQPLAIVERDAILEALRQTRGNRTLAAKQLGISRRALYNKLREYTSAGFPSL